MPSPTRLALAAAGVGLMSAPHHIDPAGRWISLVTMRHDAAIATLRGQFPAPDLLFRALLLLALSAPLAPAALAWFVARATDPVTVRTRLTFGAPGILTLALLCAVAIHCSAGAYGAADPTSTQIAPAYEAVPGAPARLTVWAYAVPGAVALAGVAFGAIAMGPASLLPRPRVPKPPTHPPTVPPRAAR